LEFLGSQEKKNTRVSENYIFSFLLIGIKDIKDLTPVRGQDGKISDTSRKDFCWSIGISCSLQLITASTLFH
jgi:hypothetical protein